MRKERGIAFSSPMVLATLDGRKTETRRVVGKKPVNRYGKVGDWLYVREKTRLVSYRSRLRFPLRVQVKYIADNTVSSWVEYPARLTASPTISKCIHHGCYKEVARIWLEITEIGMEPLWDITDEGAIAEGFTNKNKFAVTWNKLNTKRGYHWLCGPDVWVIRFKVLSTTGRPEGASICK